MNHSGVICYSNIRTVVFKLLACAVRLLDEKVVSYLSVHRGNVLLLASFLFRAYHLSEAFVVHYICGQLLSLCLVRWILVQKLLGIHEALARFATRILRCVQLQYLQCCNSKNSLFTLRCSHL